mmetsp:Transcript_22480/g.41251  ORF Transcript_22480/g.41251 Transcript_22480/m.41251 type:complete len:128 (+) Transcript_22480:19-402(+)
MAGLMHKALSRLPSVERRWLLRTRSVIRSMDGDMAAQMLESSPSIPTRHALNTPSLESTTRNRLDAEIRDIRVWSRKVTWEVAIQGAPPTTEPPVAATEDDTGNDVEVPCFASKVVRSRQRSLLSSI